MTGNSVWFAIRSYRHRGQDNNLHSNFSLSEFFFQKSKIWGWGNFCSKIKTFRTHIFTLGKMQLSIRKLQLSCPRTFLIYDVQTFYE